MTSTTAASVRLERHLDAPPEDVWAAWTDPREFARWFNPFPGLDAEVHEWDARPGGRIRFTMAAPDGSRHAEQAVFEVLDAPREMVLDQTNPHRVGVERLRLRVRLAAEGGGTRMVLEQSGYPASFDLEDARRGWGVGLGKLSAHVQDPARRIVLTRVLDAPRDLVFRAWTDAEQVSAWWGPDGFRTTTHAMDARPGGAWRYTMHGPDGTDYPNLVEYDEVRPPERLAYRHGSGEGGDTFRVTVTFEEEGGGTRLTMRMVFPTVAACDAVKAFGAVELGEQTLRRLAERLARA